jgi:thioesterase domain-containing protein
MAMSEPAEPDDDGAGADARRLTRYIAERIPPAAAMGFVVRSVTETDIELFAPLALNLNHRESAFGGSISAAAIMSGWGLLHHNCRRAGLRPMLVVQESQTRFLKPVLADFTARVVDFDPADWKKFLRALRSRGKARMRLTSVIEAGGVNLAEHEGLYVGLLHDRTTKNAN